MNEIKKLYLQKYIADTKILAGVKSGRNIRNQEDLDAYEKQKNCMCKVIIPATLWSMNSSFFIGLFGPSIKTLGEKQFREKYVFEFNGNIEIKQDIEQGILDCL